MVYNASLGDKSTDLYQTFADRVEVLLLAVIRESIPSIVHVRVSSFTNSGILVDYIMVYSVGRTSVNTSLNEAAIRRGIKQGNFSELNVDDTFSITVKG